MCQDVWFAWKSGHTLFGGGIHYRIFGGHLIGGIGVFSRACVGGKTLQEALEVVLLHGSHAKDCQSRLGNRRHRLYEGVLTDAAVSFTIEAFQGDFEGDPLQTIRKNSRALQFEVRKSLRDFILETAARKNIRGALLHGQGVAKELHVYGHTDFHKLNDKTKTFDHPKKGVGIEGWGNLSFVDGSPEAPFVHVHGVYEWHGQRKGDHLSWTREPAL